MAQQHANPVTLDNLQRGIDQLFARHDDQGKPSRGRWDFHNALYQRLEDYRARGFGHEFWNFLVDELWDWKAIRGTSKHTKQGIRDAGLMRFSELQRHFYRLVPEATNDLGTIETLSWANVVPLFQVAWEIKGVSSPTFASKLCHFLVPGAFFVTDGKLVKAGWKTYRHYWEDCRAAWLRQSDKQPLRESLRRNMPTNCSPCATYPWPTKITELCQYDVR